MRYTLTEYYKRVFFSKKTLIDRNINDIGLIGLSFNLEKAWLNMWTTSKALPPTSFNLAVFFLA